MIVFCFRQSFCSIRKFAFLFGLLSQRLTFHTAPKLIHTITDLTSFSPIVIIRQIQKRTKLATPQLPRTPHETPTPALSFVHHKVRSALREIHHVLHKNIQICISHMGHVLCLFERFERVRKYACLIDGGAFFEGVCR